MLENEPWVIGPSSLEIHLLGPFRIVVDGTLVDDSRFTRRKPKLLVKLLALQPHHQLHREQMIEFLWPDSDVDSAANNLHKAIHLARHALEPQLESPVRSRFIRTRGPQIVLEAPGELWIDIEAFEKGAAKAIRSSDVDDYNAALAIYDGDLLPEDPYEDWAALRREQLRGSYRELLLRLAALYEAGGEYQQSIGRLKQLVAVDPANEEAHRQLMRLHALTGSRREALRQYDECREALSRELDTEPERATRELREQIVDDRLRPLVKHHEPRRATPISSLAILPLENASADVDVEYLSDGITETIINMLSQLPQLRVMAHSTVSRFRGTDADPAQVGRELGVGAVLTGKVLQFGDRLSIRTELVDVADGARLWGEHYDRNVADVFVVQEEIAREISDKLRLRLTGEDKQRLTKRHTESPAAYQFYLKGRYFWYKRTEDGLRKGIEFFRQAIGADPNYAAAYDGLSDSYALLALRGLVPHKEAFRRAKDAARQALQIDNSLGEAHASLAHIRLHEWDWAGLDEEFKRALALNPSHLIAYHWYAEYLMAMGKVDEAIASVKLAQEMDPLSPVIAVTLAGALYFARRHDVAIKHLKDALEVNPSHFQLYFHLGRSYLQEGLHEDAVAHMLKAVDLSNRSTETLAGLGQAYAAAGLKEDVQTVVDELTAQSHRRYVSPYSRAKICALQGDKDQALEWLEQGYEERNPDFIELNVEPALDDLRGDPQFSHLLRRVGFE